MTAKASNSSEIFIMESEVGVMDFCILGTSPIIMNRMSAKAKGELLAPKGRKNAAEKASTLKHDPYAEFRESPYVMAGDDSPTYLGLLPTAFKRAMMTAALDMPGAKKAQIGRLVSVDWGMQPVHGIPKLFMAVTRSADINRTPDIRSRVIVPKWACRLTVTFVKPMIREQSVANLLAAAGIQSGVGDWRQEKGSGSYGWFRLVGADDPEWKRIVTEGGRAAQIAAMENPEPYDDETAELLGWFDVEAKRRGFKVAS